MKWCEWEVATNSCTQPVSQPFNSQKSKVSKLTSLSLLMTVQPNLIIQLYIYIIFLCKAKSSSQSTLYYFFQPGYASVWPEDRINGDPLLGVLVVWGNTHVGLVIGDSDLFIYLFIWFLQVERFEFCNGIEEEEERGRKEGFWVIFNSCNGRPREESHGVWQWKEENGCLTSLKKWSFLVVALKKFHQHRLPEMVFFFIFEYFWFLLLI